jgi:hypothetical protein
LGNLRASQASLSNREVTAKGQSPKFTFSDQKVGNCLWRFHSSAGEVFETVSLAESSVPQKLASDAREQQLAHPVASNRWT